MGLGVTCRLKVYIFQLLTHKALLLVYGMVMKVLAWQSTHGPVLSDGLMGKTHETEHKVFQSYEFANKLVAPPDATL
jgi:hypothetical protein